ncbi:hypothetical protein EAH74_16775 [Pseudomonas mandelii]|uniref:Uncharacterized protein n=1 Tax=Pseudomonas mandelii TaxID=75612 RepID=A0A502ID08_9PSED|nr:hypothetical protein EAH74_16775 [Pseudomonas mandelii]
MIVFCAPVESVVGRNAAFASKPAPTVGMRQARQLDPLWERACSRRGPQKHQCNEGINPLFTLSLCTANTLDLVPLQPSFRQ